MFAALPLKRNPGTNPVVDTMVHRRVTTFLPRPQVDSGDPAAAEEEEAFTI